METPNGDMSDEVQEILNAVGIRPFFIRHITQSFYQSEYRKQGLCIGMGAFYLRLGPQTPRTGTISKFAPRVLDHVGVNPYAVEAFAKDFLASRIRNHGLQIFDYATCLRCGPQGRNTLVLYSNEDERARRV